MGKTIYIDDGDALNIDRVIVNNPNTKWCKVLYSCDLIDEYEDKLKADMADMLTELKTEIEKIEIDVPFGFEPVSKTAAFYDGVSASSKVIQQKINALKGGEQDGNNR